MTNQQEGSFRRTPFHAIALILIALSFVSKSTWGQTHDSGSRNFDRRSALRARTASRAEARTSQQSEALAGLDRELRGSLRHEIDPDSGVTRSLSNPVGYLTAPEPGDPADVALAFVRSNLALLGLAPGDVDELDVTDIVSSAPTGATHVYLGQRHQGLPVYNAQLQVHVNREGRITGVSNAFVPGLAGSVKSSVPVIDAAQAVSSSARHLNVSLSTAPRARSAPLGAEQRTLLSAPAVSSEPVEAELMWLPVGRELTLVWRFQLHTPDDQHIYDVTVDAEAGLSPTDGNRVVTRFDWVNGAEYRVYPAPFESPQHKSPSPPADGRALVVDPADPTASPLGWHSTGSTSYTILRGNNVHAYEDSDANNLPPGSEPSCGSFLNCDFPISLSSAPSAYRSAATANLFYWNNLVHDVQYQYGFDEAGGNFQVNNFGKGGAGADDVRAEAQDGSGTCNANFATPTDGGRPRMQMYTCGNTSPARDGDLDNGVIVHEYGHGISIRQVGGPSNSSCLNNRQQGGEGWSDFFALVYTAKAGDRGTDARGIGTYLFGQPANGPGIRPQRYSTDPSVNNYTYASINGLAVPHGVGSVWAQVLWEVYWALVDEYGFDGDLKNVGAAAGNHRALLYVNEGLKNTACSPTFVDARDGIIQAAVDNFGGADVCLLWSVFASFGLGTNAVSGGSNSTTPTNGFDLPAACTTPPPPPPVCPAGSIDFTAFGLESYSNQDGSGSVSVEDGGDTLRMEGNRWVRSTQSFEVTPSTVLQLHFRGSEQGEISGIGFDEDQTLTNNVRIFQFWGTQNWTGAQPFSPRYSGSGNFESFSIPVGQFYTGSSMRLVFVNDKDAGSLTNLGRFSCVEIQGGPAPNTVPSVTITAPANGSTFDAGASVSFSGSASDAEDGNLTGALGWTSSLDGVIGSGGSFSTSSLSVGAHTVTASVTDSGGLTGSASIGITIKSAPGCAGCIDWNQTPTVSYSNQDGAGSFSIEDAGATFSMTGNRWRRTTRTFNVTPFTVVEFDFRSTSQGEIHGIGFEEDDNLNNNVRIFQIFGTQNWSGAFQFSPKYTTGDLGSYVTFRIPVGQFYTGSNLFLVLVNDKDAGTANNTSSFRNVRVFEESPPTCGLVLHETDFESGANGWSHSAANSSCTTGSWVVGDPDPVSNGGVTTQLGDDHSPLGVNAFFTQPNIGGAGTDDVDGGVCTALSPVIDAASASTVLVSLWYYHGQRDPGDDPAGDFFDIQVSRDGGATYTTSLVSISDVTTNAAWTEVTATVTNPGQLRIRVRASDGAATGDLVEGGLDDVRVCMAQ